MTEVKHAGGIVSSSKVPALHLIPTEALLCLAERFEVGTERKGEGAWNALTKNQQCLDDNAFLIERCSHIIRHTMLLRDQLAHGFNDEEDSPYENAGAIIFGGALMACAMVRRGDCLLCGKPLTKAGWIDCFDCREYAREAVGAPTVAAESPDDWVVQDRCPYRPDLDEYRYLFSEGGVGGWTKTSGLTDLHGHVDPSGGKLEIRCRRKDLPVIESPDDWVVQDRVPARATDRGAWVDRGEDYPAYDFSSRHWWTVGTDKALGWQAGDVDAVGRTLHLICRRKDLPPIEAPKPVEEEWVDLNKYPDHVLREGVDQCRSSNQRDWVVVDSLMGDKISKWAEFGWEFRCLKKDRPHLPLTPFSLAVGPKYECRNGQTVGPLGYNITQKTFFAPSLSHVTWNPTGWARKVDVGMSNEAEKGWDIVELVRD